MAFSGMDKDERQASGIDFWEGGKLGKKFALGFFYRTIMLENVSVDVVDGARVKGACWGCPSVSPPGRREGVKRGKRAGVSGPQRGLSAGGKIKGGSASTQPYNQRTTTRAPGPTYRPYTASNLYNRSYTRPATPLPPQATARRSLPARSCEHND